MRPSRDQPPDELGEDEVEDRDVQAHHEADREDEHGQVADLQAGRPGHLLELGPRFVQEAAKSRHSVGLLSASDGGRGDRTRTYNRWFWRPVLCQLSYTPTDRDRQRLVVTWPPGGGCGAARV